MALSHSRFGCVDGMALLPSATFSGVSTQSIESGRGRRIGNPSGCCLALPPCHLPTECMLRLLDCAAGTAQDFEGHDDSVHLCRFTPSGRLLFTAAHNEILVWEVTGS